MGYVGTRLLSQFVPLPRVSQTKGRSDNTAGEHFITHKKRTKLGHLCQVAIPDGDTSQAEAKFPMYFWHQHLE